jgi:hypothetical protein
MYSRKFPCNNCIQRRLPERCVPPPGTQYPPPSQSSSSHTTPIQVHTQLLPSQQPIHHQPLKTSYDESESKPRLDIAETTARLARLERLLSLQDHTYAEKRLRLAEEAVLGILEMDGGADVSDTTKKEEDSKTGSANFPQPSTSSQHQNPAYIETREEALQRISIAERGIGARSANGLNAIESGASAGSETGGVDENIVELLGDNGYNGATALAALSRAPVLTRVSHIT